jgi:predicted SAM-dependent methyltransferase
MKLNIGCGNDYRVGFVNIDCRELARVDMVFDLLEIDKHIEPESVEYIHASDVLEHISHRDIGGFLEKLCAIMMKDGQMFIRVPNGHSCARALLDTEDLSNEYCDGGVVYFMYGAQNYPSNFHYNIFTYESICAALGRAGFSQVSPKTDEGRNMSLVATK